VAVRNTNRPCDWQPPLSMTSLDTTLWFTSRTGIRSCYTRPLGEVALSPALLRAASCVLRPACCGREPPAPPHIWRKGALEDPSGLSYVGRRLEIVLRKTM
jgi:hypothetical protein